MSASHISDSIIAGSDMAWSQDKQKLLVQGEILVETRSHKACGGAVTAWMYLPMVRSQVWQQLTDYPRWVQYFPDITKSEISHKGEVKRSISSSTKSLFLFHGSSGNLPQRCRSAWGNKSNFVWKKGLLRILTPI